MDERVKRFSEHLLLVGWSGASQGLSVQPRWSGLTGSLGVALLRRTDRHLTTRDGAGGSCRRAGADRIAGRDRGRVRHLSGRHAVGHRHTRHPLVPRSRLLHHTRSARITHHRSADRHHTWRGVSWHRWVAVHGLTHVALRTHTIRWVLHTLRAALGHLGLESLTTDISALSEGNVKRLGSDHLPIHFLNSFGSLVRGGVTDETKILRKVKGH